MSVDNEENYNVEPLSKRLRLASCSPSISNTDERNSPYKFQNEIHDQIKMKREQLDAYLNQQSSEIIPIAVSNTPLDLTKKNLIENHNSPPDVQQCHAPVETSTPCSKQSTTSTDTQKSKDNILDVSPIRTSDTQPGDLKTNKTNDLSYNPKQNFIGKFYAEYGTRIFIDNNNGLQLKSGIQLDVAASLKDRAQMEDQINVSNLQ